MKLNYRDKILLTSVIVILVWVIGIMFFIRPAWNDVQSAREELDNAKVTLSEKEELVEKDKNLKQDIVDAYNKATELAKNFYDYQEAQNATQIVDDLLATDNLVNTNMTINVYSTSTLAPYVFSYNRTMTAVDQQVAQYDAFGKKEETAAVDTPIAVACTVGTYSISVNFRGTKDDVKSFCENLKSNDEKTLFVQTLTVAENEEEGAASDEITGSMSLQLIVLPKLSDPNANA